jgi:hypothetical protein
VAANKSKKSSLSFAQEFRWFLKANRPCNRDELIAAYTSAVRKNGGKPFKSWDAIWAALSTSDRLDMADAIGANISSEKHGQVAGFLRTMREALASGLAGMVGSKATNTFHLPNLYGGRDITSWATDAAAKLLGGPGPFPMADLIRHIQTHGPSAAKYRGKNRDSARKLVKYLCAKYKIPRPS